MSNSIANLALGMPLAVLALIAPWQQVTLAQVDHGEHEHHHPMIGIDHLEILTQGEYAGLVNPNYNRLTFIFPHIHDFDVSTSHFHAIGTYSYTGDPSNPTVISTSTNNRIPETRFALPPLPLQQGEGVFSERLVNVQTEDNFYSNFKFAPIEHLVPYLDDPIVNIWYNSSNRRWPGSIGDAKIALELVSITPGLGVANSDGVDLFSQVGDRYFIGEGDNFSFRPVFYTSSAVPDGSQYSAAFKLVDINSENGREPLLESGTFNIDFQATPIPEPLTILGVGTALGFGAFFKRKFARKKNEQ